MYTKNFYGGNGIVGAQVIQRPSIIHFLDLKESHLISFLNFIICLNCISHSKMVDSPSQI